MDDQRVYLNDNKGSKGFYTNKYGDESISSLNQKILKYINSVYGTFGFKYGENKDINIKGQIINTEYISKMVNNYTIFKTFIRENEITSEDIFYNLLISNFDDVYHYNGVFFKRQTLPILINTTRKGNEAEKICKEKFTQFAKSKNLNIIIEDPTIEEDVNGIDAKFYHNNRYITIQIKPFTNISYVDDEMYIKSSGSLSIGSVDYLMLYRQNTEYIILKNTLSSPIKIKGDTFISPLHNILVKSPENI